MISTQLLRLVRCPVCVENLDLLPHSNLPTALPSKARQSKEDAPDAPELHHNGTRQKTSALSPKIERTSNQTEQPDQLKEGTLRIAADGSGVFCLICASRYEATQGYLKLLPPVELGRVSNYSAHEEEFAHELDYLRVGKAHLGAAVRLKMLRQLLPLKPNDKVIDIGCGNGKFAYWQRHKAGFIVGVDTASFFSEQALRSVNLLQGEARRLPFADQTFEAAFSIDVMEHLDDDGLQNYFAEAYRVLKPGGRFFIYSNTREMSRLNPLIAAQKRFAAWFAARGIFDFKRDILRKSDHVKAIKTWPELVQRVENQGYKVQKVVFWNGLFQTFVENIAVKAGEYILERRRSPELSRNPSHDRSESNATVRDEMRQKLGRNSGGVYPLLIGFLTSLMYLDLVLFGQMRTGCFFVVLERPATNNSSQDRQS